jgi:predicted RNase H-like HicB family nuclease
MTIEIKMDNDGIWLVSSPDMPGFETAGVDIPDALQAAADAAEEWLRSNKA